MSSFGHISKVASKNTSHLCEAGNFFSIFSRTLPKKLYFDSVCQAVIFEGLRVKLALENVVQWAHSAF